MGVLIIAVNVVREITKEMDNSDRWKQSDVVTVDLIVIWSKGGISCGVDLVKGGGSGKEFNYNSGIFYNIVMDEWRLFEEGQLLLLVIPV